MSYGEIKAIPTEYKGYRMRSRLEARWAVFFDALELDWEYEAEGLLLPNGVKYLPDFLLHIPDSISLFVEVKHGDLCLGDPEFRKAEQTASFGRPVLILNGPPDAARMWNIAIGDNGIRGAFFCDLEKCPILYADGYWHTQTEIDDRTGFLHLPHDEETLRKSFGQGVIDAVKAARSARFA